MGQGDDGRLRRDHGGTGVVAMRERGKVVEPGLNPRMVRFLSSDVGGIEWGSLGWFRPGLDLKVLVFPISVAKAPLQVLALASGILFGLATPASKVLVGDLGPYVLAGLLYLGAALAMLPVLRGKSVRPTGLDRQRLLGAIVFGGILGPLLLLFGLQVARASSVSIWLNLELVWTAVLGLVLFREPTSRWSWLAVGFVVAASTTVAWAENHAGILAGLLVAGACLAWGLDNHWTAQIRSIPASAMTFWKGLVGGAVNLAVGLLLGSRATMPQTIAALAIGVVCYGISITLYVMSARGIGATRAQVLFSTAPLWGVLVAVLALDETWSWRLGLAVALVGAAVACLAIEARSKPAQPHPL
jgi:drug/metabolite transporter (DMT)-like permease